MGRPTGKREYGCLSKTINRKGGRRAGLMSESGGL